MLQLFISVFALLIGVSIYPAIKNKPSVLSFFDAFVLISIVGLTMLHLIPHSVESGGIWGLAAVSAGFAIPSLLHLTQHPHGHRREEHEHAKPSRLLLIILFFGIIIHTLMDGIGLSMADNPEGAGRLVMLGVLFHRLPIGIFLSLVLMPLIGLKKTWTVALIFAAATCAGFILGRFALPHAGLTLMTVIQGLIAGALLHVVFHNIASDRRGAPAWPKGLGALAGLTALIIIEKAVPEHQHSHGSILDIWMQYLLDAAPIWCTAAAVIGILYLLESRSGSRLQTICRTALAYLDPQPHPAVLNGRIHGIALSGAIVLAVIFNFTAAAIFLGTLIPLLAISRQILKKLPLCPDCQRDIVCSRKKSFPLWTCASITIIALSTLLASVLPTLSAPISDFLDPLPSPAVWTAFVLASAAVLVIFCRRRGRQLASLALIMFTLYAVFHTIHGAFAIIAWIGGVLLWLYDFHPRDIVKSMDNDEPYHAKFTIPAVLCAVLSFAIFVSCTQIHDFAHPVSHDRIEISHHHEHQIHDAQDAQIDHHSHAQDEFAHDAHEHADSADLEKIEHAEFKGSHHGEQPSYAKAHTETDRTELHVHHDVHDDVHDNPASISILTQSYPRTASLFLFLLTALFWLLKIGPREMFETAQGRRHHAHDE